jgi:hypothetical protein
MTIADQVKKAILETCGMGGTDVSELDDNLSISEFSMNEMQLIQLTESFNDIVYANNPKSSISIRDVEKCKTVKDCISLVIGKI